jgi:rhamnosyltransferase
MPDNKPKFAIFLAAKDGMPWLPMQIESIEKQNNINYKLYINLDLSKDESKFFLERKIKKNKNIRLLISKNSIGSPAKNFFWMIKNINFRKFDYLAFSDQDDIWFKNKLICAHKAIIKNNAQGYSSNLITFGMGKKKYYLKKDYVQKKFDYLFESVSAGCTFVLTKDSATLLRNFLIKKWNKINKINNHDWFIYAFYRFYNLKWFCDKKYTIYYRQHNQNFLGANVNLSSYIKRIKLIVTGWYSREIRKIYNILISENKNNKLIDIYSNFEVIKNINETRRRFRDRLVLLVLLILFIY